MNTTTESPAPAGSVYTAQDQERVRVIKKWLADAEKSRAWLSTKASIPSSTLSLILAGKYVSSPTQQLAQILSVLDVESLRLKDGTPGYVQGSVHRLMLSVCDRTRKHQNFGVVTGYVGIGKTRFLKEYRATKPMTVLVEASPNMTPGVLLTELLEQLNTAVPPGLDRKFREVVRVLRGTNYLLMADEAERLSPSAMEYLRRIRDIAEVGVVLCGTERLSGLIKPLHGQFDQVRSRVGIWPKTIERISRDDADEMARAALADMGEISDKVLEALWNYGQGSARVLNESLVGALRDFAKGHVLTAQIVETVAHDALFMAAPRKDWDKA